MWKEFREFATRGSVVDMTVGIVVGGALGTIAKSLVEDVLMPPLGFFLGAVDFSNVYLLLRHGTPPPPYASLAQARHAGAVTLNVGLFANAVVSFLVLALAMFLIVRLLNRWRRLAPVEADRKDCPRCLFRIPARATRCGHCTSDLAP
ncbi:MAG: large conductance mechanosensitive channel protein MscL [Planctomycetales bacterium]|nr:large conductance mechanosensitive channel protein MscL [Planctomycetales bacterium]